MYKKLSLAIAISVMTLSGALAQTARKITIANSADNQSTLEIYFPENPTGRAIVDCPGGGYAGLSMQNEGHNWAEFFNEKGITYGVLKYRMPNGDRNIPLTDAYQAIKTMRDSAKVWNVNPNDVGIMGFSAGGHLASSVSTHAPWQSRPNFSILVYPVISMNEKETHKGSCVNFLGEGQSDEKLVREWSNQYAVRRHLTPPAVIFLAADDLTVPPLTNGFKYYESMVKAGNPCALYVYPSGGHGFGFRQDYTYHDQMLKELSTWLDNHKAPNADAIKVACIGNSITDGAGIPMADVNGYPAHLQKLLGDGYKVMNFGVSARTMLNKGDHPYMNEQAWKDAQDFNPDIVVIKLGTNDSKPFNWKYSSEFSADMQQMINTLKALPSKPRILVATPIPAYAVQWGIRDSVIVGEVIPQIRKVAKKNKLQVIELHEKFDNSDNKQIQPDAIHPTAVGAAQMARIIYEAIKK
jgi:acetyl esterase/lipase/lysophospholipase L1-like esterase